MVTAADAGQREPEIVAFGDLASSECIIPLQKLLRLKSNADLTDFFARVGFGLRQHLGSLSSSTQELFPKFTTLNDLVYRWEEATGRPALHVFLLSVLQIAQFICHYGGNQAREFPSAASTCIISSCVGEFVAVAASCSRSTSSFVPLAVEAALTAFRTGLKSYLIGSAIVVGKKDVTETWSVSVSPIADASVEELLSIFAESRGETENGKSIWISASTPTGSTSLGGKPSVLSSFVNANKDKLRVKPLNVASPFHAPHLFAERDVDEIMGGVDANVGGDAKNRITLISSQTTSGTEPDPTFIGRLRMAVYGVLREQLDLNLIFESCGTYLTQLGSRRCRLTTFTYGVTPILTATLANAFAIQLDVEDASQSNTNESYPTTRSSESKIAIVGYSGRFPSAESNEAFWELLRAGRDVHREVPSDRFDWRTHYDADGKIPNTSRVKNGCWVDKPGLFDARFFSMSPREAENTDPAQRLAILTTYEAMEMAGFVPNRTPSSQADRVGVFLGSTSDDWREINASQNVDTYFIPGGNRAFGPGRISYYFRLSGPSISVDTACSSSFVAIQAACSYLRSGQCDTAIAGGTNILTNPNIFSGLDRAHFLSTTGNCNAFDDEADGYCRADAVGTVMLKRLEDAEADNDPIFGVIVDTNINHCGHTESITRPHEGDQAALFQQILRQANYNPLDVNVIEMHGTGTQAGDATEMNSILSIFVPQRERTQSEPARPLYIGSAKASVGHSEAASGVTSLIKVLLMLKHKEIPPHCGIKTKINRSYPLDLAERGVRIAMKPTPWQQYSKETKRAAFLNNFSAAGGNTAMLLEEAPRKLRNLDNLSDFHTHLVAVTAKTPKSLVGNAQSLVAWLRKNADTALSDLSYTTTARRMHHDYRMMVSAQNVPSLIQSLESLSSKTPQSLKALLPPTKRPKLVFVFTGQGSLYIGMGIDLYQTYNSFRQDILQLNHLAESCGFLSFIELIDGSTSVDVHTVSAVTSQLALLCVQIALVKLLGRWRIQPGAVMGHSLGEYAALCAAGVISAGDAIYLVGKRATLLEQHCKKGTHGMLVVKGSQQETEHLLQSVDNDFEVACANHPTAHVVAGPKDQIPTIVAEAHKAGLSAVELNVPYAFHTNQINPILSEFDMAAAQAGLVFNPPKIPVLSPLLKRVVYKGEENTLNMSYLVRASRGMVDFSTALNMAQRDGLSGARAIWLEVGAHPMCGTMVKQTLGPDEEVLITLKEKVEGCKTLLKSVEALYLAGWDVDWNEYHRDLPVTPQVLELPHYAWDLKNYWIDYKNDFCVNRYGHVTKPDAMEAPIRYKYISPTAQKVLEELHDKSESSMTVESDIFDPELLPILHGHAVNGAFLCPSSLYAEIGLTLGAYLLNEQKMCRETTGLEVCDLHIDQPLIAKPDEKTHCFRVQVHADWTSKNISLAVFSVDSSGGKTVSHARLSVCVAPQQNWLADWRRNTYLIASRMKALELDEDSQKLRRRMVYKLFASLVDYDDSFKGMSEVLLNSEELEAVSTVNFQASGSRGEFGIDARWIDSLGQVSGFIMNANDTISNREKVFINHGWEKLRYAEKLDASKSYKAYCRMQLAEKTTYIGDIFVLDDNRIVALYEGVKFIGMSRQVLNHVLPPKRPDTSKKPIAPTTAKHVARTPNLNGNIRNRRSLEGVRYIENKLPDAHMAVDRMTEIICQEIGVPPSDLEPESQLADLGIDSLLSLTITTRIREELGMDVVSTALLECQSVGELQHLFGCSDSFISATTTDFDSFSNISGESGDRESSISSHSEVYGSEWPVNTPVRRALWETIAGETATSIEELTPSTAIADIGIDSLLAITMSASLCEKFSAHIPSTLILGCETLLDIEAALCKVPGIVQGSCAASPTKRTHLLNAPQRLSATAGDVGVSDSRPATSALLSGSPGTAKSILILFPDGSGSAASYATLAPQLPRDTALYGLNCPWRKNGLELTSSNITVPQMVASQLVEVRRIIESHKQYGWRNNTSGTPNLIVGGWSAGGILAYEAVQQFAAEGIAVRKLILLDSPDPVNMRPPPRKMSYFLEALSKSGGRLGKAPDWVLDHFDGMMGVLGGYRPAPLPESLVMDTLLVYARKGSWNEYDEPNTCLRAHEDHDVSWILRDRTDFTAGGWKHLLGPRQLSVKIVDDADHFSLMEDERRTKRVGNFIIGFLQ